MSITLLSKVLENVNFCAAIQRSTTGTKISLWPIVGGGAKNSPDSSTIFILFPKSFESGNCFDVGCCWNPSSDVKPSLLHFTFWIYRNKSTNRTGHRTIIVVVKTFRSVVMQNILIQIHHQIFWLPWISIIMKCHYSSQNGDCWGGWAAQHLQCVCKWTIEQGPDLKMK